MTALSIPDHVRASATPDGGTIVLNAHSGQWYAMNATAHGLWQEWQRLGEFRQPVQALADRYPASQAARVVADAERLVADLIARGLMTLEHRANAAPSAKPTGPFPTVTSATRSTFWYRGAAPLALLGALLLVRLPFRVTVRALTLLKRHWCRYPATDAQGRMAVHAIEATARIYPGRAACLEVSLGSVVTMALFRRYSDWCLGTSDAPCNLHAWVDIEGRPVTHDTDAGNDSFRRVLVI